MSKQPSRRTYAVMTFLTLLVCYGYFLPKKADWNGQSHADLTYAIGDKGVLYIDDYEENTGDKAFFEGHYYTDKAIGPSLVALPFYMAFKAIVALPPVAHLIENAQKTFVSAFAEDGNITRQDTVYRGFALTFITFFTISPPSALLGTILFLFATRFAERDSYAFVLALTYGLATMAFPYSNVLYQHQLSAFSAFVSFFLLWRVIYEKANVRWLWLVGVLMGLGAITEYPIIPFLGVIFLWTVYKLPNRMALYRVVLGALPFGLLFAAYNIAVFHMPITFPYHYQVTFQGTLTQGFMGMTTLVWDRLYWWLTFSPFRGLFLLSPVLLVGVSDLYWMWKKTSYQSEVIVSIIIIVGYFVYNAAYVIWWGGDTVGPRYLASILPFMTLPMIFSYNALFKSKSGIAPVSLLILLSLLNVWGQSIAGQTFPLADNLPNKVSEVIPNFALFDISIPLLAQGDIARNYGLLIGLRGLSSLIPLLVVLLCIYVIVPRLIDRGRPAEVLALGHPIRQ